MCNPVERFQRGVSSYQEKRRRKGANCLGKHTVWPLPPPTFYLGFLGFNELFVVRTPANVNDSGWRLSLCTTPTIWYIYTDPYTIETPYSIQHWTWGCCLPRFHLPTHLAGWVLAFCFLFCVFWVLGLCFGHWTWIPALTRDTSPMMLL